MFTRIVEISVKPGKMDEVRKILQRDVIPVLKKQQGFVDSIGLISDNDPNNLVSVTLWHTKGEAERYHRDVFPSVMEPITQLITNHSVKTYNVELSTFHKIAAGKAA